MFPRSLALAAAVVCGIAPLPARAADPPPNPLRTIGFVAERTIAPGESWTVPAAPPGTATTTYRVAHVEQNDTTDAHLVATLVSDTFAKR